MLNARYRKIIWFFLRIIVSIGFWDIFLVKLGFGRWAEKSRSKRLSTAAINFRNLAIQLGGVMIKVGQFLSTRVDVLPNDVTDQLTGLQDEVPAEPFSVIKEFTELELGMPLEECFLSFNPDPVAAASLGQAHQAVLADMALKSSADELNSYQRSQRVVVKIQRPGIERIIQTDLAALRTVGKWLSGYRPIRKRANVMALLDEFSKILYEEIDYLAEGRNIEIFADNFKNYPGLKVPEVFWTRTTRRVLTLEDVSGIKIDNYDAITAAGINRHDVAVRLLEIYFKQIFEDGFFHADPHSGNLFVRVCPSETDITSPVDWQLVLVDFGMVGRIPNNIRNGLREAVMAVGTQDASRLIRSYESLGVLLPDADIKLLEKAEKRLFERYWGKSMSELRDISPQEVFEFVDEFRELIYRMPFQIPQNLLFLARAIGILSGMCTGLAPDFNVWEQLSPYARKLILDESRSTPAVWLNEFGETIRKLFSLPRRAEAILTRVERGDLMVQNAQLVDQIKLLSSAVKFTGRGIVFSALLLGTVQVYLSGKIEMALGLGIATILSLFWMVVRPQK
jgi:predicted unusual protein kinase regulating ubiquinone biosynthesis (AarF/ABC1/UbiB family)